MSAAVALLLLGLVWALAGHAAATYEPPPPRPPIPRPSRTIETLRLEERIVELKTRRMAAETWASAREEARREVVRELARFPRPKDARRYGILVAARD